jgi:Phage P22-like portal protein
MTSDILDLATKRYELAKDGWNEINQKAKNDQQFLSDAPFAQWDSGEADKRVRLGRPVVEIDQLSQYTQQVKNDIRLNTPTIKVIPAGSGADIETAEIIEGRIKAIEYKSNADSAYDLAAAFAVDSLGFIRVDHGYVSDKGFEQELKIKRVINPQAVLIDPDSIDADGSDAKYCFVLEDMSIKEFTKMYPKASPVSFGETAASTAPQLKDKITIAEYYYIEEAEEEYGLLDDGSDEIVSEDKQYKQTRKITKRTVMKCWLSGKDVLEKPTKFPGKYIPLVPVYGREQWINGKRNLLSLIRKAKSSAMMYNALKSSETEILLKQQQAPVQAAVGQMRGFEDDWKAPDKAMVLYYHQTDANGQPAPAPQRLNPPVVSSGYAAASIDAENNIKKSLGMYSAAVGNREGDSSGIALKQLEQSSDLATADFNDNLVRSITHVGKIIVCALPEVEDTQRLVQIVGREDEIKQVGINGAMAPDQKRSYDFKQGEWDVRVITGASYTTQRQEAAAYYGDLVGKMPDLMPVIGDLVFKYQDAPGAQAISSRLKKLVDPKLLDESEQDNPESNSELEAMTQEANQVMQAAQAEIQQLQQQLEKMAQEAQTDEAKRAQDAVKVQITNLKQQQRIAELELKNQLLQAKAEIAAMQTPEQETPEPIESSQYMGLSEEALAAQIESLRNNKMLSEQQAIAKQQREAMEAEQKAQREAIEEEQKLQREAFEMQQRQMLIQSIGEVKQALVDLNKPKFIVKDANNEPIGIR